MIILAPLRSPYLIDQLLFQVSRSPGFQLPGYNLNRSQPLFTTDRQLPMHGASTYTCHIKLYIPNPNHRQKLNERIRAFIYDKFLPRVVEEFQDFYIFSDTNADYNNLKTQLELTAMKLKSTSL